MIAAQGAETIIAIDVGAEDNNDLENYGDHISGWYLLWNKINPFAKKMRVRTGSKGGREGGREGERVRGKEEGREGPLESVSSICAMQ